MTAAVPRLWPAYLSLLAIGAAWGLTTPLVKTATIHGHPALSIALWQTAMTVVVLGAVQAARGRLHRTPLDAASIRLYLVFGLLGLSLPQWASFTGTTHLPAGVMSMVISLVPIFALPLALALGSERFSASRLAGVGLGAGAIVMLAAPGASLPQPGLWVWVLVGALAPLFYAFEGAYVAASRAPGAGPFQLLWAGSVVALVVLIGLNLAFGGLRSPLDGFGTGEAAIVAAGALSMAAYAGYIALLQRWGAVFGAQVAYTVTGCGVVWAMLILGERYPPMVWAALAALFAGLFLVQPRAGPAAPWVRLDARL
jgi:drug/metabolite transporter (DMT)-like permease